MNKEKYITVLNWDYAIYRLIEASGEKPQELIKQILDEKEKYNLTNPIIISLIARTEDTDFIKSMITNGAEYNFSLSEMFSLVSSTNDVKFIEQFVKQPQAYGVSEITVDKKIKLPKGMTIGIEIESEGELSAELLEAGRILEEWEAKEDGSLDDGVEIISPILKSENSNEQQIYDVCAILKLCKNYVSERCGGHIHIGVDYLKDINAWKNLLELWSNAENLIYIISNTDGEVPRSEIFKHAAPISQDIEEIIENGEIDLENEDDVQNFCKSLLELQRKRESGINFYNLFDRGTIEFRLSNGTINPKTWIENINLFGGMIAIAQELSVIQNKIETGIKLTEDEQNKISLFEEIKSSSDEQRKLECFLGLVVDDIEASTYLKRYRINRRKISCGYIVKDVKPININKKQLGKLVFIGQDSVTGDEYTQGSAIIRAELFKDTMLDQVFD